LSIALASACGLPPHVDWSIRTTAGQYIVPEAGIEPAHRTSQHFSNKLSFVEDPSQAQTIPKNLEPFGAGGLWGRCWSNRHGLERTIHTAAVAGSIPPPPTTPKNMVRVGGSDPSAPTTLNLRPLLNPGSRCRWRIWFGNRLALPPWMRSGGFDLARMSIAIVISNLIEDFGCWRQVVDIR
jgi:hypothetical protein